MLTVMITRTFLFVLVVMVYICEADQKGNHREEKDETQTFELSDAHRKLEGLSQADVTVHYKKLFAEHRKIQIQAVKSLMAFGTHEQRVKLVDMMLVQLFNNMQQAKENLTLWGVTPGDPIPTNTTVRDAYSKVLENTALFGDMVLRLPDLVHAFYNKQREWHLLIAWAYDFCNLSDVIESPTDLLLSLMAQEVKIVPADPNYVNPFKAKAQKEAEIKEKLKAEDKKELKKKKFPRGPRLSKTEL